jgi:cytochrome c biogenesis protein CcmG/thiol:disulfide interchange protein DsbE
MPMMRLPGARSRLPGARARLPTAAKLVGSMLAVAMLGGCRSATPSRLADSAAGEIPAANATRAPLLPTLADALPGFTLARYGELLRQLRGTPVVVTMWGSWCPPCDDEAPMLAAAHARYGDRVQFLGIDIEDSVASARAFIRRFGWTFPSIRDPAFPSSFRPGLGFAAQPNTLFYDASGRLVDTWQGPLTAERLRSGIEGSLRGA